MNMADAVERGIEAAWSFCFHCGDQIGRARDGGQRTHIGHLLQLGTNTITPFGVGEDHHHRLQPSGCLIRQLDRVTLDNAFALQSGEPLLHGGACQSKLAGERGCWLARIVAQQGNQLVVVRAHFGFLVDSPGSPAFRRMIAQFPALRRLMPDLFLANTLLRNIGATPMKKVMLVGGGKIGGAIASFLNGSGDYRVTVADRDADLLERLPEGVERRRVMIDNPVAFAEAVAGHDIVLSATPYHLTVTVAEAARAAGAHYLDLTEDVDSTRVIKKLAEGASTAFIPQCGLAPGFISIAAYDLAKKFERLRDLCMRVGALPVFPTNALKYNLTWSTDGLINEYCNPCESIRDGVRSETPALEEIEHFALDGTQYEAFNTSGGLGTLCETLDGRVENLNYKTVRYPGHRDIIKMLVRDLRLGMRRDVMKDVLETAIPITHQDVVLIFITVSGWRDGRLTQESFAKKIYAQEIGGKLMSAIQITTAAGICTMCDLLVEGKLPQQGFVRQEDCKLDDFLANRFGRYYA